MIPYGRQFIDEEDKKAVLEALESDWLTTGPKVGKFEEKFACYVGAKYAVAVSSGTAALHLACLSLGLQEGDELITSPMTFAASANCGLYCGVSAVFVDIKKNGLINEDLIKEKITSKTKVIIPVHYQGHSCDMKKINKIAKENNLFVIEDACHALGSIYSEGRIGDCKYSDMSVFSFHPVKHITTGEGGIITTNSKKCYEKLISFRSHGVVRGDNLLNKEEGPWFYEMHDLGYNYRITDIQCALGLSQLSKIDKFVERRREIAKRYDDRLSDIKEIEIISEPSNTESSYHLYVIKVENKDVRLKLFEYLKENEVFCQVHYIPVYWHPYYKNVGYEKGLCPRAENFYERIISIPIYPGLSSQEQEKVIRLIRGFYE